jgi:hypothetical protein
MLAKMGQHFYENLLDALVYITVITACCIVLSMRDPQSDKHSKLSLISTYHTLLDLY